MLKTKSCYRCDGDVYLTGESELNETTCLQCGAVQYSKVVKIEPEFTESNHHGSHKKTRRKAV